MFDYNLFLFDYFCMIYRIPIIIYIITFLRFSNGISDHKNSNAKQLIQSNWKISSLFNLYEIYERKVFNKHVLIIIVIKFAFLRTKVHSGLK